MALSLLFMTQALPADDTSDASLVQAFLGGDDGAFNELVRRHDKAMLRFVSRIVRDEEDARDITQKAFLRAFRGLAGFRGDSQFRSWLYRIASNLAFNHLRDRKRQVPLDEGTATVPAEGTRRLEEDADRRKLREALEALPPKQRLVLELRVYEELPFREVAVIAECSENAAKVNYHHAVKRLKQLLGEADEGGES